MKLVTRALTSTGLLKKGLGVGASALNSEFGEKIVGKGIKHAPELHKFGTSKIKNKSLKKALESELQATQFRKLRKRLQKIYLVSKNEHENKQFSDRKGSEKYEQVN